MDYFTLSQAGKYCGRCKDEARWSRRHLMGVIPHFHPPGSGVLFKKEDVDAWLEKHRREPVNADAVFANLMG
ncbi:MAG TPA: helix-turn-helix domain-containing protein, partial [Terriglobales bacterium]|nr:helix-turn-helix domain-containing protein [Terriglobales bacterium]